LAGLVRVARHSDREDVSVRNLDVVLGSANDIAFLLGPAHQQTVRRGRSRAVINQADGILTTSPSDGNGAAHPRAGPRLSRLTDLELL